MNSELDKINLFDLNFQEMDSNYLLEFDNYSNILDSSPDSLKLNDDLFLSIFSPANLDCMNAQDHAYCLMPKKQESIADLVSPQFLSDISENQLENITGISFEDIDFGNNGENIFDFPTINADMTDAKEQIPSNNIFQSSFLINSNTESSENQQNNECNIIINDNFLDNMNTFDIEEEYDSLSDNEDIEEEGYKHKSSKNNSLPMTIHDLKPNRRTRFKDNCQLILTQEEKNLLSEQGCNLPTNVPLTREEDRILKAVRRKIRNKYAAKMSRQKKQDYMEGLERRVKYCTSQNQQLQYKVGNLEKQNSLLVNQLKQLQNLISKNNPLSSESMESLGKFAHNKHAQTGTCFMLLILSFSLFILPSLTPFFASNQQDSLPIFGNSRKILQLNSAPALLIANQDETVADQDPVAYYLQPESTNHKSLGDKLIDIKIDLNKYKMDKDDEGDLNEEDKENEDKVGHASTNKMKQGQEFDDRNFDIGEEGYEESESDLKNSKINREVNYQHIASDQDILIDKSMYYNVISNNTITIDNTKLVLINKTHDLSNFELKNQNITNLSFTITEKDL